MAEIDLSVSINYKVEQLCEWKFEYMFLFLVGHDTKYLENGLFISITRTCHFLNNLQ